MLVGSSFIYLGEFFCSYISVGNYLNYDVWDVGIKVSFFLGFYIVWMDNGVSWCKYG